MCVSRVCVCVCVCVCGVKNSVRAPPSLQLAYEAMERGLMSSEECTARWRDNLSFQSRAEAVVSAANGDKVEAQRALGRVQEDNRRQQV